MIAAIKSLSEINAELEEVRAKKKKEEKPEREKRDWYGLVHCEPGGYASVIGDDFEGHWLGKTDEIIPFLKSKGIDGTNINSVLVAVEDFRAEQKNQEFSAKAEISTPRVSKTQSCHSAIKKPHRHISIPPQRPNRATFSGKGLKNGSNMPSSLKKDKKLTELMTSLVARDIGIPTIHRELNEHGYAVPYRTVGRWVAQMRTEQLL